MGARSLATTGSSRTPQSLTDDYTEEQPSISKSGTRSEVVLALAQEFVARIARANGRCCGNTSTGIPNWKRKSAKLAILAASDFNGDGIPHLAVAFGGGQGRRVNSVCDLPLGGASATAWCSASPFYWTKGAP